MTKGQAKDDFIETIATALLTGVIVALIFVFGSDMDNKFFNIIALSIVYTIGFGGVIPGWKWISSIITAVSLWGIVIKLFIAVCLGWIILPVKLIRDIVYMIIGD